MSPTVTFRLLGAHLREDERVAVVGSTASLGFWSPQQPCYLNPTSESSHELRVITDESRIEYKYVIVKESEIQWEGGANRLVLLTDGDVECADTWESEGASEFLTQEERIEDVPAEITVEIDENAPLVDNEPAAAEVDENAPHMENIPPKVETKDGAKKGDKDLQKPSEAFTSPDAQRSPFLLIDGIVRMCSRGTTNAK